MADDQSLIDHMRGFTLRAELAADKNTLRGFASVFDTWYDVNDHLGTYRERFKHGSYARTLKARHPVCMFDHGQGYLGGLPLGPFRRIEEQEEGLFFEVPMHRSWIFDPVREAIASGAITGCSVRFTVPEGKDEWSKDRSHRTILECKLFELGPVVMPASTATSVALRSLFARLDPAEVDAVIRDMRADGMLEDVKLVDVNGTADLDPAPVGATRGALADGSDSDQSGTTRKQQMDKRRRERLLILRGVKDAQTGPDPGRARQGG